MRGKAWSAIPKRNLRHRNNTSAGSGRMPRLLSGRSGSSSDTFPTAPRESYFFGKLFRCSRTLPVNQVMDKAKFIKRYTSHNGSFSLFLKCNVNCVLKVKIGLFIPVLPFNCCKSRNRIDNIQKTDIDNRKI